MCRLVKILKSHDIEDTLRLVSWDCHLHLRPVSIYFGRLELVEKPVLKVLQSFASWPYLKAI